MNARLLMRTAVAASLLIGAWAARPAIAAARPAPPNFVVIMVDDQDDENSMKLMPHLQDLAAQGVRFTNSLVDLPLCCPSRASFLTGQAATNSGISGNKPPHGGYSDFAEHEQSNIGAWLQTAGYRTAIMGKLMNGYGEGDAAAHAHIMPGWNEWDVLTTRTDQDPDNPDQDHVGYRYFSYTLNENGVLKDYRRNAYDYQTDVLAAKGEQFIRASSAPFFLLLQPIAPHGTHGDDVEDGEKGFPQPAPRNEDSLPGLKFQPTANFNEAKLTDKTKAFQAMAAGQTGGADQFQDPGVIEASFQHRRKTMLAVDDMLKRVVDTLRDTGQLDNTYIIFTSDNGYSHGSHRWQGKVVLFEESIHVPLVIAGPGVPRGEVRDQLVNNLDVVATIMDRAGATPEGRVLDGHPLTSLLENASTPWRTAILVENHHEKAVRTKDWMYGESLTLLGGAEQEMYSLSRDPQQLRNVAGNDNPVYQSAQAGLKTVLDQLRTCAGAACWYDGATPAQTR